MTTSAITRHRLIRSVTLACGLAACSAGVQAVELVNIDFSEVPLLTTDPTIEGVAFSAGDPLAFEDTITDDSASPTDPYLVAGVEGSGAIDLPAYSSTSFIHAAMGGTLGGVGETTLISFDAGFFAPLPTGSTIFAEARLGGVVQGSDSVTTSGTSLLPMSISLDELGFDEIYFYDPSDFGSAFRIDNLIVDVSPKQGPGPSPIPVPGTLFLMALGMLGFGRAYGRRGTVKNSD